MGTRSSRRVRPLNAGHPEFGSCLQGCCLVIAAGGGGGGGGGGEREERRCVRIPHTILLFLDLSRDESGALAPALPLHAPHPPPPPPPPRVKGSSSSGAPAPVSLFSLSSLASLV